MTTQPVTANFLTLDLSHWALPLALLALALFLISLVLLGVLLFFRSPKLRLEDWSEKFVGILEHSTKNQALLMGELRAEMAQSARQTREELAHSIAMFQESLMRQGGESARIQNEQLDCFGQSLAQLRSTVSETLLEQLHSLSKFNTAALEQVRLTLESGLSQMQSSNEAKLEQMRQTVDEKLQSTLQMRLGESFKLVAERLEQVYKGLGQMQTLAQGVGDLKHLLSNVKTRGIFGETQLGALLEQVLPAQQYDSQVVTRAGSREMVDFAIRLPGRFEDPNEVLWLPIDAKFPLNDYEQLLDAQQRCDSQAASLAASALEGRIRAQAKSIADKYIDPPHTTDFAILFLPAEGLYAEVLRRPGLIEDLQRTWHITIAGPTTLLALLNALQMGFRTLALQRRSSEVWLVLGEVKSEFAKFGDVLDKVKRQTQSMLNTLDETGRRSRAINRKLLAVEALPEQTAPSLESQQLDASNATSEDEQPLKSSDALLSQLSN